MWKDFTEVKNLDNKQLQNITHELYSWQLELCNFILAPDLKRYIDSYIRKPLSQRKIDPLRFLIPQMCSKDMFAIFDQDSSQAKREFFKLIERNSELKNVKDQQKVFYVLLELFDRERAGIDSKGYYHCNFRPLYSLTQSERNKVKIWYKKNMPDTDLFDDLEIENEEDKEQDEQESNINIIESNTYNSDPNNKGIDKQSGKINTSDIIKNNLGESSSSYVDTNEISFNRSKKTIKKSKTLNLGYKIGLVLDILATAIFIYLAITISLYFLITLAITVPIGIFFGLRLCQGCLIFGDNKIKTFDVDNNDGHFYSETCEPENEPKQDQKHDLENDQYKNDKPVKIVIKN